MSARDSFVELGYKAALRDAVVHAHWEEYYGDAKCTSCGFVCGDSFYLGSARFCPVCGAKMDEEVDA